MAGNHSQVTWAGEQAVLAHLRACKQMRMNALHLTEEKTNNVTRYDPFSPTVPFPTTGNTKFQPLKTNKLRNIVSQQTRPATIFENSDKLTPSTQEDKIVVEKQWSPLYDDNAEDDTAKKKMIIDLAALRLPTRMGSGRSPYDRFLERQAEQIRYQELLEKEAKKMRKPKPGVSARPASQRIKTI